MKKQFVLGGACIGQDFPPLFLPEIGNYFGQDVEKAKDGISQVLEAGFKVIKGEVCHNSDYVLDTDLEYEYNTFDGIKSVRYKDFISSLVLPLDTWYKIYGFIHDNGVSSVISAYDMDAVDFIADVGSSCVKLASNNINNLPLIQHAAKKDLAIMFDTGKASMSEVARALEIAEDNGCANIYINHNPDGHPAPSRDHNLKIIDTYRNAFHLPIGVSDHYQGDLMMYVAAALNYDIIEKPCVHDPYQIDVDAAWTLPFSKMSEVNDNILECWKARGNTRRDNELRMHNHPQRMGIISSAEILAGEPLTQHNISVAYPCLGISVGDWHIAEGAIANKNIPQNTPIRWENVQPTSKS